MYKFGFAIILSVLSLLCSGNPVFPTTCLHPVNMIEAANRTLLAYPSWTINDFNPPFNYELYINASGLGYCEFNYPPCNGDISYYFVYLCQNSTNPPIKIATVHWDCDPLTTIQSTYDQIPNGEVTFTISPRPSTAVPDLGIVMFVSSIPRTGGATLQQFDTDCQNDATGRFVGTYKAFIAVNDTTGPLTRFNLSDHAPVVRPDRKLVVNIENELFQKEYRNLINLPDLFANGSQYNGNVWTGFTFNPTIPDEGGLYVPPSKHCAEDFYTGKTCDGWSCGKHECPTTSGTFGTPDPDFDPNWKFVNYTICSNEYPVYCLRQDNPVSCPTPTYQSDHDCEGHRDDEGHRHHK